MKRDDAFLAFFVIGMIFSLSIGSGIAGPYMTKETFSPLAFLFYLPPGIFLGISVIIQKILKL